MVGGVVKSKQILHNLASKPNLGPPKKVNNELSHLCQVVAEDLQQLAEEGYIPKGNIMESPLEQAKQETTNACENVSSANFDDSDIKIDDDDDDHDWVKIVKQSSDVKLSNNRYGLNPQNVQKHKNEVRNHLRQYQPKAWESTYGYKDVVNTK